MSETVFILALFSFLVVLMWAWFRVCSRRRSEQLREVASALGFVWSGRDDPLLRRRLEAFWPFRRGTAPAIRGQLVGTVGGAPVRVIDYSHGSLTNNVRHEYLIIVSEGGRKLPSFSLRPRTASDGLMAREACQDELLSRYAGLSNYYVLDAEPPLSVVSAFLPFWDSVVGAKYMPSLEHIEGTTICYTLHSGNVTVDVVRRLLDDAQHARDIVLGLPLREQCR